MLSSLHIRNYTLIESLDIDFFSGFSVITGETGAGKSILLGAISLILGGRSDSKVIRLGCERCMVEACFDISDYKLSSFFKKNELHFDEKQTILRRELSSNGRSRAFINDTPVSLVQLKELGEHLIDIHSQHQNLLLANKLFQLNILDILAENRTIIQRYKSLYDEYRTCSIELTKLKNEAQQNLNDEDWIRFQLTELSNATLKDGELEELEQESLSLTHVEEIQEAFSASLLRFENEDSGLLYVLRDTHNILDHIKNRYQPVAQLADRIESCYIELKDCFYELKTHKESVVFDPQRFSYVEQRLSLIYDLLKKHRKESLSQLIVYAQELSSQLDNIETFDFRIVETEKKLSEITEKLTALSSELSSSRLQAALLLKEKIIAHLVTLGMPHVRFQVDFSVSNDFTSHGKDEVDYIFSANSSSNMQPISEVASGGEMARFMLALKVLIAGTVAQPTLIFDEIDTGISGILAERMGRLMQQMGNKHCQVISITHLPQVAALGDNHYRVSKHEDHTGTHTSIVKLDEKEKISEIAQMLSGESLSQAALDNAVTLIKQSKKDDSIK